MWLGPIIVVSLLFWASVTGWAFGQTIQYDMGGSISARLEQMRHMDGVRIEGRCYSACTMYLGLPKTCVTDTALLGFHSPHAGAGIPLQPDRWELATRVMAAQYPPLLSEWFMGYARYQAGPQVITGSSAILLGVQECEDG